MIDKIIDVLFLIPIIGVGVLLIVMSILSIVGVLAVLCGNESVLQFAARNFYIDVPAVMAVYVSFLFVFVFCFLNFFAWCSTETLNKFLSVFSVACLWYLIYMIDVWYTNIIEYNQKKKLIKDKK